MNKCSKCGTEFEGKFCPECGAQWSEEKTCPKCGAKLHGSARFCNECGYSFTNEPRKGTDKASNANMLQKIFSALHFVPFACIALFSVLLFAFYSAPVAELVLGMGLPNVSLGNVYSMRSGILSEIPEVGGAMIALIIYAVVSVAFAVAFGIVAFLPKFKYKEVKLFKKWSVPLTSLFGYISFVLYLLAFIFGIVIICTISSADEGMGFFTKGACPVLLIVFSLIFAALAAGSFVGRYLLAKKKPEVAAEEVRKKTEYIAAETARKERFFATHSAPVAPVMGEDKRKYKKEAIVYKHAKRRYDNACESATPTAVIWMDVHKIPIIVVACLVILAIISTIILTSILIPILNNKFKISVVEKIQPGYTQEQVRGVLGSPYAETSTDDEWQYYSDPYIKVLDKLEKNEKDQERALERGDDNKLLKLVDEELRLEEELSNVVYDYIEICFTKNSEQSYVVSSVLFEKNKCDNNLSTEKQVSSVKLSEDKEVGYYVDETGEEEQNFLISYDEVAALYYSAYFTDGSFYRTYLKGESIEISDNVAVTTWTDMYSSYECSNRAIVIGTVDKDGKWKSWNSNRIVSIALPDSVKVIGSDAFSNCEKLKSIYLPASISSISSGCFKGCSALEKINISENNVIYYSENNCIIKNETNTLIVGCKSSIIPASVTAIGSYAFSGCSQLTSITIPASVTAIGNSAFSGCSQLTSITIPARVTSIGDYAFSNCRSLNKIDIDSGNMSYSSQDGILYNYDKTEIICVPGGKQSVTIPASVTSIGDSAFYGCDNLQTVTFAGESKIESIGREVFYGCSSLTSIEIPASVTSIGYCAFFCCTNLQTVTFASGSRLKSIDDAFYGCGLTAITIPASVTAITDGAFSGCDNLQPSIIENNIKYLGSSENPYFYLWEVVDSDITNCKINERTEIISRAFRHCTNLQPSITENNVKYLGSSENPYFYLWEAIDTDITNCKINERTEIIGALAFEWCSQLTEITIPANVTSICDYAFEDCYNLQTVTFASESKLESINECAFWCCSNLTEITIPASVTSIGDSAFNGCSSLNKVNITDLAAWCNIDFVDDSSNPLYYAHNLYINDVLQHEIAIPQEITKIKNYAFSGCYSITSIAIPASVTSIGDGAFWSCSGLTSITIPASVTSIGDGAFSGCYALKSVNFENPDSWKVSEYSDMREAKDILPSDLQNQTKAAEYLSDSYRFYYWKRT